MLLEGAQFGRLTVLRRATAGRHAKWWVQCACGSAQKAVDETSLRRGHTRSCGCWNREVRAFTTHGEARRGQLTPEYRTWLNLRDRCLNKNNPRYEAYGGRGITVDPRWDTYEIFLEDMGRRPGNNYTIERKKNHLGYSKDNCRWATNLEQAGNKRNNTVLAYDGRTQHLSAWARELKMRTSTLSMRLYVYKWSIEKALSTPVRS